MRNGSRVRVGRGLAAVGVALMLVVASGACSKCGGAKPAGTGPTEVTRWLPPNVEAAVVVPDLGVLGDRFTQLQGMKLASFAAQLQGYPDAPTFANDLIRQAGVDVRSRDELKKAGIAPDRGLGVALLPGSAAYAVIAISDEKAFGEFVKKLAQTRLGAGNEARTKAGTAEVVTYSRGTDGKPQLGYVFVDGGFALIAAADSAAKLGMYATLTRELSLASVADLKTSLARLPADRDLYVYAPQNLEAKQRPGYLAFTATLALAKDALKIRVDTPWPGTTQTVAVLDPKAGPDLTAQLPSDAFAVARFGGDPVLLDPIWPMLTGPHLQRAFADAGVDVKQEVLANLKPGAVASFSVSPTIPMGAGMPTMDVRRTNPFKYAHLVAVAQPEDPAKVSPLLQRMPQISPRFGAKIEPVEKDGKQLFVTSYAQGEGVHFATAKDGRVVFASPLGRLEQTLTALDGTGALIGPALLKDPTLKDVLIKAPVAAVVDLNQLRESVSALPPEAWGIGGFAIKASAQRWLDATDDLRAITVSLSRKDNAVQADVALRFTQR